MVADGGIKLEHVGFLIGDFSLEDVCLEVPRGEYFVLTGPNGAGKSILMKLVAGLHTPASGGVFMGQRRVNDVPPWERNIGYVPQEYGLFPNLTVEGNIAFGLAVRRTETAKAVEEVGRIAALLGVSRLLKRMPKGLSGGEQQRVSLARALVLKPDVLLLDEPVSAIDEEDRDAICAELKSIHRTTGVTTVHVCHSSREAELVGDRTGVLKDGRLSVGQAESHEF